MIRILLAGMFLLAIFFVRIPASLVDRGIQQISAENVSLAQAEGTLWHGEGILLVKDRRTNSLQVWQKISWVFVPRDLLQGAMKWNISSGNLPLLGFAVSIGGVNVDHMKIRGSARSVLESLPIAFGQLGWAGDMSLDSSGFNCSWRGICKGRLNIQWFNAASDLLPEKIFGDYLLLVGSSSTGLGYVLNTLRGDINIDGIGHWESGKRPVFKGTIQGDPAELQSMSSVLGPLLRPTENADVWSVVIQ